MMSAPLFLHEELLLLALKDEQGTIEFGADYGNAIGGAALAQLLMEDRVRLEGPKKNAKVRSVSAKPLKDAYLDDCSVAVRTSKRLRPAQEWVRRFASTKNLKHRVAESLCDKGVLRAEHDKVLGIFSRKIYPEADGRAEEEIVERLRAAIFSEAQEVDTRTTVLIALANATGLLKLAFGKKELARRKARIERIVEGDLAGQATKAAVEAMQAAMFVAVFVPVVIS